MIDHAILVQLGVDSGVSVAFSLVVGVGATGSAQLRCVDIAEQSLPCTLSVSALNAIPVRFGMDFPRLLPDAPSWDIDAVSGTVVFTLFGGAMHRLSAAQIGFDEPKSLRLKDIDDYHKPRFVRGAGDFGCRVATISNCGNRLCRLTDLRGDAAGLASVTLCHAMDELWVVDLEGQDYWVARRGVSGIPGRLPLPHGELLFAKVGDGPGQPLGSIGVVCAHAATPLPDKLIAILVVDKDGAGSLWTLGHNGRLEKVALVGDESEVYHSPSIVYARPWLYFSLVFENRGSSFVYVDRIQVRLVDGHGDP